ncbi:hypothetical protein JTB14_015445 [Gonioctena quinquepunctata]|nr:hypothetical protein JTB14_015445 [Gonioctena quinquepunctata]
MEKKQEWADSCHHTRAPSSGNLVKTNFLQIRRGYSVICTNCNGTCENSQVPSQDSDEEEVTETVLEQTYDEIEEEEDHNEADNPIADDVEEISICNVSTGTEDDELATPGQSRIAKRRKRC